MILHGKDLLILDSSNNAIVAMSKSCDVDINCETIEVSSSTNGVSKTYIPGRTDWSVSVSYIVTAGEVATDLLRVGDTVTLQIKEVNSSALTGTAIIQQCKITATKGDLAQGSFVFKGSGTLEAPSVQS